MEQCEFEANNAQSISELQKGFCWGTVMIGARVALVVVSRISRISRGV